jgi:hypothetical protein
MKSEWNFISFVQNSEVFFLHVNQGHPISASYFYIVTTFYRFHKNIHCFLLITTKMIWFCRKTERMMR